MRQKADPDAISSRGGDVRKNLTSKQLEAIGAVIIAWNELEIFLHIILGNSIGIPLAMCFEVSHRVNGSEALIEIIKKSKSLYPSIDKAMFETMAQSYGAFEEFKKYRDAVAHARVFHSKKGIGTITKRKADEYHVLLTVKALNALYRRLIILRKEFIAIAAIFSLIGMELKVNASRPVRAKKQSLSQDIQAYFSQLQRHQNQRQSLRPLPKFPVLLAIPPNLAIAIANFRR